MPIWIILFGKNSTQILQISSLKFRSKNENLVSG